LTSKNSIAVKKFTLALLLFNLGFLCGCAWSHRGRLYGIALMLWCVLGILADLMIQFGLDIAGLFRWVGRVVATGAQKLLHRQG
jgi:hypothetical protein